MGHLRGPAPHTAPRARRACAGARSYRVAPTRPPRLPRRGLGAAQEPRSRLLGGAGDFGGSGQTGRIGRRDRRARWTGRRGPHGRVRGARRTRRLRDVGARAGQTWRVSTSKPRPCKLGAWRFCLLRARRASQPPLGRLAHAGSNPRMTPHARSRSLVSGVAHGAAQRAPGGRETGLKGRLRVGV